MAITYHEFINSLSVLIELSKVSALFGRDLTGIKSHIKTKVSQYCTENSISIELLEVDD
jgi:hypothetical protein